jgi:hypothetical protein
VTYYLAVIGLIYAAFLLTQRADRRSRQAFATRLGALYRARGEFWRLRVWAQEAHDRGDVEAGARFTGQAAALLPGITGESTALRREHQRYVGELGWTAGLLDDELADMGRVLAAADLRDCDRWVTGRGRTPVEAVLNPMPAMDDDLLAARMHMGLGMVIGAVGGLAGWLVAYWGDMDARLSTMFFFIVLGAAVLGHVGYVLKDRLWSGLAYGIRHRGWTDPL